MRMVSGGAGLRVRIAAVVAACLGVIGLVSAQTVAAQVAAPGGDLTLEVLPLLTHDDGFTSFWIKSNVYSSATVTVSRGGQAVWSQVAPVLPQETDGPAADPSFSWPSCAAIGSYEVTAAPTGNPSDAVSASFSIPPNACDGRFQATWSDVHVGQRARLHVTDEWVDATPQYRVCLRSPASRRSSCWRRRIRKGGWDTFATPRLRALGRYSVRWLFGDGWTISGSLKVYRHTHSRTRPHHPPSDVCKHVVTTPGGSECVDGPGAHRCDPQWEPYYNRQVYVSLHREQHKPLDPRATFLSAQTPEFAQRRQRLASSARIICARTSSMPGCPKDEHGRILPGSLPGWVRVGGSMSRASVVPSVSE